MIFSQYRFMLLTIMLSANVARGRRVRGGQRKRHNLSGLRGELRHDKGMTL